jgi:hypothetical protein
MSQLLNPRLKRRLSFSLMFLYNAEVLSTCPNVVKLDITKRKKNSCLVIFFDCYLLSCYNYSWFENTRMVALLFFLKICCKAVIYEWDNANAHARERQKITEMRMLHKPSNRLLRLPMAWMLRSV